jgi:hypothetical protein
MEGRAGHLVFDDQGKAWPADSLEFRQRLLFPENRTDFVPQVVQRLGFISAVRRRTGATVTFRPRRASPVALASLLYWLSDEPPERICLAILDDRLRHELYGSLKLAIERMHRLIEAHQEEERPPFTARGLSPSAASDDLPFRWLLTNWERSDKHLSLQNLSGQVDHLFDGRFCAARPGQEPAELVFERLGSGLPVPDPEWRESAHGTRVIDMPDRSYGRWVSQAYLSVLCTGRPEFDDVSAHVYWPQSGRLHCEYRRLILPCVDADGHPYLLSVSRAADRPKPLMSSASLG